MIVAREREIRNFVKTKYYKINVAFKGFTAEWKVNEKSSEAFSKRGGRIPAPIHSFKN